MKKAMYFITAAAIVGFAVLILKNPKVCINATTNGLNLCSKVLIPSLFPFTFCVLFLLNIGICDIFKFASKPFKKLFGMDSYLFSVFLISLIGGYPLGAKVIDESLIDKKTSLYMLNFCVNAGPAFIITAIGNGIFHSKQIGFLLFACHILPSFVLAFFFRKKLRTQTKTFKKSMGLSDNFVLSAAGSASALLNICSFSLLFSIITAYFNIYSAKIPILKPFSMLLEITNGVNFTDNILVISALLGFGGISVWCQIFSLCKKTKPNISVFILCRMFHGVLSAFLTFCGIKFFNISLPAISNGKAFDFSPFADTLTVGISLAVLLILFMISIKGKNYAGNLLEDIV